MWNKEEFNQTYRYCLSLTGDQDAAYELLQVSFEKFLRKDGARTGKPKAYLFRIIRNQFIDDKRRNIRWQFEEFSEEKSNIALLNFDRLDDLWVSQKEMEYILGMLSAPERELLYLWAVEGFTIKEISEHMEIPKGTLLSRLYRLKKKLRNKLGHQYNIKSMGNEKAN